MKMSTKSRYGLRFMIDLATNGNAQDKVPLQQVAKRQAISEKYLWQIANRLKAAGLIRATVGPHGGYALAKSPLTITLRDILAVLEEDCTLVACVTTPTVCPRSNACASREVWKELDEKLVEVMKSITLSVMAAKEQAMAENSVPAYSI